MTVIFAWDSLHGTLSEGTYLVLWLITIYNVNFGIFNLIPIPPLDGSHVLKELLPRDLAYRFQSLQRHSMIILLIFLLTPFPYYILRPLVNATLTVMNFILSAVF